jgi:hypothetical protein
MNFNLLKIFLGGIFKLQRQIKKEDTNKKLLDVM